MRRVAVEDPTAEDVIERALGAFDHGKLGLACSFQKEESVLLDMLLTQAPGIRVFTIDTGVLFEETISTWKAVEDRYGVQIEVFDATAATPWTQSNCCGERKVEALQAALHSGLDAWITGMRREQAPTRAEAPKWDWDEKNGLWKLNPLADWTDKDVWRYIADHDLPYNPLHDQGYASIGCAPCTLPGNGREGRWAGDEKTECGLHV